ncbi:MAG: bactofilin family protein [Hyphomicrobiaceae bacterium]
MAGRVEGRLHCRNATIAENATVIGDVIAHNVVVAGTVDGSIYANSIVLHPKCAVFGDMYHEKLQLHEGCYFEGRSRNAKNPQALAFR